jgi:putative transposase
MTGIISAKSQREADNVARQRLEPGLRAAQVFTAVGIEVIRTPPQAPKANAIAERWVGTVRRECTDRLLITGERHLRVVLDEYLHHYNNHRPHRTLGQQPPNQPRAQSAHVDGARVDRRPILGGLIKEYAQAA